MIARCLSRLRIKSYCVMFPRLINFHVKTAMNNFFHGNQYTMMTVEFVAKMRPSHKMGKKDIFLP